MALTTSSMFIYNFRASILSRSSFKVRKHPFGVYTYLMYYNMSPNLVF